MKMAELLPLKMHPFTLRQVHFSAKLLYQRAVHKATSADLDQTSSVEQLDLSTFFLSHVHSNSLSGMVMRILCKVLSPFQSLVTKRS